MRDSIFILYVQIVGYSCDGKKLMDLILATLDITVPYGTLVPGIIYSSV